MYISTMSTILNLHEKAKAAGHMIRCAKCILKRSVDVHVAYKRNPEVCNFL
jgi:hypothetical protein